MSYVYNAARNRPTHVFMALSNRLWQLALAVLLVVMLGVLGHNGLPTAWSLRYAEWLIDMGYYQSAVVRLQDLAIHGDPKAMRIVDILQVNNGEQPIDTHRVAVLWTSARETGLIS